MLLENYQSSSTNWVNLQDTKSIYRNLVISKHSEQKIRKRDEGNNPIYRCIKKTITNSPAWGGKKLYLENYETLMKEVKDDRIRC